MSNAMEALSVSTQIPDAYRAGVYLGEHLAALNPEVVFLFTSIDYGHNSDILAGLQDSLNQPNCIIIGNSGDGFYETLLQNCLMRMVIKVDHSITRKLRRRSSC